MSNNRNWLNKLQDIYTTGITCSHSPKDVDLYISSPIRVFTNTFGNGGDGAHYKTAYSI